MVTLIEPIGEGGFATVWRARDAFGREVAAKVITHDMVSISDARDHARALAQVTHPAVVRFYSLEKADDPRVPGAQTECVLMELVTGGTLEDRLRAAPLRWDEVKRIGEDLCEGVDAIHAANVFHGDLGPVNVMVADDGRVQIIDLLYRGTLVDTPRQIGDARRHDVRRLAEMLHRVLAQSVLGPGAAETFTRGVGGHAELWWVRHNLAAVVAEHRPLAMHGVVPFYTEYSGFAGAAYFGIYRTPAGEVVAIGLDLGYPSITNFAEWVADAVHARFGTTLGARPQSLRLVHYHEGEEDPIDRHRSGILTNDVPLCWNGKHFSVDPDGIWRHPTRAELESWVGESLDPLILLAVEQREFHREPRRITPASTTALGHLGADDVPADRSPHRPGGPAPSFLARLVTTLRNLVSHGA